MINKEFQKFGRNDFSLNSGIGMITPCARKLYLTFPAASTFTEEDVFYYFSIYGPVHEVRIPYRQKRVFGFVTFVYPETVKLVSSKPNPHLVCDDCVHVKPYKEKEKNPHKKLKDMFSDLPDCLILHILSFLNTHHAVRTCILSSRWKNLWKNLPALILGRRFGPFDFLTKMFTEFVSMVLSRRDPSMSLHTLDIEDTYIFLKSHMLRWIDNYAISHNVQRLRLSGTTGISQCPLALFSSQTLTHLTLSISNYDLKQISLNLPSLTYLKISCDFGYGILFPKSFNFPALSTLELEKYIFFIGDNECAEPFSTFNMLKRLFISNCTVKGSGTLNISNAMLVNFTIFDDYASYYYKINLCTPNLCTFAFRGVPSQDIFGSNISSLKHVDIDATVTKDFPCGSSSILILFNWLSKFENIKSLTVSASTLQILSLSLGWSKFKIPSMSKLKLLKVKIDEIQNELRRTLWNDKLRNIKSKKKAARIQEAFALGLEPSPLVPDGIVDFLLQNSPSAEVDLVDCRKKPLRKKH